MYYTSQDKKLFKEWYPQDHPFYDKVNKSEKQAILTLKTGIFPRLRYDKRREYNYHINKINCIRIQNKVTCIPPHLWKVKYRALIPVIQDNLHPDTNQMENYYNRLKAYKERLRLKTLEIEVTKMITSGMIPKMSEDK